LKSPHVLFSGYKVPHPLEAKFELRVQTDGEVTAKKAVMDAAGEAMRELGSLSREFTKEWELRRMVGEGGASGSGL
jgi:DNA-directed RNA polymerase II subunit RPB11